MDKQTAQQQFQDDYNGKTGIVNTVPLVDTVTENKHGIDNPVTDLNIRKYLKPLLDQIAALQTLDRALVNAGEVVVDGNQIIFH
jgi:hypothetical protein